MTCHAYNNTKQSCTHQQQRIWPQSSTSFSCMSMQGVCSSEGPNGQCGSYSICTTITESGSKGANGVRSRVQSISLLQINLISSSNILPSFLMMCSISIGTSCACALHSLGKMVHAPKQYSTGSQISTMDMLHELHTLVCLIAVKHADMDIFCHFRHTFTMRISSAVHDDVKHYIRYQVLVARRSFDSASIDFR